IHAFFAQTLDKNFRAIHEESFLTAQARVYLMVYLCGSHTPSKWFTSIGLGLVRGWPLSF
ncbi:hypothetical protein, partial [Candidatus Entotheonella palauensis]|uniref:hypothetical protein n=1 Tax=Candidatus Entotheonella palauensis TaxID=93172 RepID=UPI001C4DF0C9